MARPLSRERRSDILKGLFQSYYGRHDEEVVFDTNRAWTAQLPALMQLFPDARLICTVRDVAWVLDSLERQYTGNAFENTKLFNSPASSNRLVGFAYRALREACRGEHAARLVMVDYDLLTAAPGEVIRLLHQFLGEPEFEHDFNNVVYDAPEFDAQLGLSGFHRVRRGVSQRGQPFRRQWQGSEPAGIFRIHLDPSPTRIGPHVAPRQGPHLDHQRDSA